MGQDSFGAPSNQGGMVQDFVGVLWDLSGIAKDCFGALLDCSGIAQGLVHTRFQGEMIQDYVVVL